MVGQTLERREVEHQVSADSVTAVAITDGDLVCTMVNAAFCILFERTSEQVVERPITGFERNLVRARRQPTTFRDDLRG